MIRGKVWIFGDNINTDLMHPQLVNTLPIDERPKYCMYANRPGWSGQVRAGDIIVAGKNFGCGSSRPAAKSLKDLGIACLLAESINGLFLRNAINFGLPALECKDVLRIFAEGDEAEVDLSSGSIRNLTTAKSLNVSPLPGKLIEIVESGGLLSLLRKKGYLT